MSDPFLGELKLCAFNFPPKGWALANGQLLPINQNQALFSLFGTVYGGNGQTTFALPDLRGRTPIHVGNGTTQGEKAGEEAHTLTLNELPAHIHFFQANAADGDTDTPFSPAGSIGAFNAGYGGLTNVTTIAPSTIKTVGGSQAHNNMQPYLTLSFCIALVGIFPSQN